MVRIHLHNKEKKERRFIDAYGMALFFGALLAVFLIIGTKGLIFLIKVLIEYWLWVLLVMVGIVFIKRYLLRKIKK
jgi:hypothetical protein